MKGEGAGGRMHFGGVLGTSAAGLRRHPGRTMLTALGTNLIRVTPGSSVFGNADGLPAEAAAMLARAGPVERVASTALLDATALRNERAEGEDRDEG